MGHPLLERSEERRDDPTGVLEKLVVAQANLRHPRNGPREDAALRPQFLLRRRSQHYRRDLNEGFIIFGKLEAGVFEGLVKIVELGKSTWQVLHEVPY